MVQEPAANYQAFADKVKDSVRHVETEAGRLRAIYTRLLIAGTVSSAATTLVAGLTAARGPIVGEGPAGWRISCAIAAILGFTATLCIALSQQLGINERLTAATQSLGRLKYLDVCILTGTRTWDDITREYQDIVQSYPEAMR